LRGEWIVTHQGIAFDENGLLVDGQHRLLAIIDSGRAVDCMVTRNLSTSVFSVTDGGIARSLKDRISDVPKVIEALRLLNYFYQQGVITPKMYSLYVGGKIHTSLSELISIAPTSRKNVTRVGFFLAAAIQNVVSNSSYAFEQYKALSALEFDDLSEHSKCFLRRIESGKLKLDNGGHAQVYTLIIGMKLFDELFQNNKKFMVPTELEIVRYTKKITSVVQVEAFKRA